jgi:hypothetical protein
LIDDKKWQVRCEVARQGYGLERLIDDKNWFVRREVARQGYRLDKLIDDKAYDVRREVAKQGYGLEKLVDDEDEEVRYEAERKIIKITNIDNILKTQGIEAVGEFCLTNSFKHLNSYKNKKDIGDIRKAKWFLNKFVELFDKGGKKNEM